MAEVERDGLIYNKATGRYLRPAAAGGTVEAGIHVVGDNSVIEGNEIRSNADGLDFAAMKVKEIKAELDKYEIEYPPRATRQLLVEIAEQEIG